MNHRVLSIGLTALVLQTAGLPHTVAAPGIEAPAADDALAASDVEQQRKEGTVTAGVLILVGISAIGLLLIAAALIWGSKVRRLARDTPFGSPRGEPPAKPHRETPTSDVACPDASSVQGSQPTDSTRSDSTTLNSDDTRT